MATLSMTRIAHSPPPQSFNDRAQPLSFAAVRDSQPDNIYDYGTSAAQGRPRRPAVSWGRASSSSHAKAEPTSAPAHIWEKEPLRKEKRMGIQQYDRKQKQFFQDHILGLGPYFRNVQNHCSTSSTKSLFQRLRSMDQKLIRREFRHEQKRERKLSIYKDLRWIYACVYESEFPSYMDRDGDFCMLEMATDDDDELYGAGASAGQTVGTSSSLGNLPSTSTLESWGFTSNPSTAPLPAIPTIHVQPPSPQYQGSRDLPPSQETANSLNPNGLFSGNGWPLQGSYQGQYSENQAPPHSPVLFTVPLPS